MHTVGFNTVTDAMHSTEGCCVCRATKPVGAWFDLGVQWQVLPKVCLPMTDGAPQLKNYPRSTVVPLESRVWYGLYEKNIRLLTEQWTMGFEVSGLSFRKLIKSFFGCGITVYGTPLR